MRKNNQLSLFITKELDIEVNLKILAERQRIWEYVEEFLERLGVKDDVKKNISAIIFDKELKK
jgi:transcription initiation factor TFIIIB Brf1 subunit/transcription initiation factor TFIIB